MRCIVHTQRKLGLSHINLADSLKVAPLVDLEAPSCPTVQSKLRRTVGQASRDTPTSTPPREMPPPQSPIRCVTPKHHRPSNPTTPTGRAKDEQSAKTPTSRVKEEQSATTPQKTGNQSDTTPSTSQQGDPPVIHLSQGSSISSTSGRKRKIDEFFTPSPSPRTPSSKRKTGLTPSSAGRVLFREGLEENEKEHNEQVEQVEAGGYQVAQQGNNDVVSHEKNGSPATATEADDLTNVDGSDVDSCEDLFDDFDLSLIIDDSSCSQNPVVETNAKPTQQGPPSRSDLVSTPIQAPAAADHPRAW
eukprot:sb/3467277/